MTIICIGQSTLDISMPLDQPIIENLKFRVYDKLESAGGPATTASILLGKWGEDVQLVSRLGQDIYATHIKESLKQAKVKHIEIPCVDFETSISVILINKINGNRTIFNCPSKIESSNYEVEGHYDLLLTDGHEAEIAHRFLDQHPNIISVLDAGGFRQPTVELAKRMSWVVSSQDFAENYAQLKVNIHDQNNWIDLFKKLHLLNDHFIVTLGELGCLYEEGGVVKHCPAYPEKAVDTNGAGDIFHGAFVYGLAHNYSLRNTLELASMASSISVTRRGGSLSIPTLDEVIQALKTKS